VIEQDLTQIHRRLDEYERDLIAYYAATRGATPAEDPEPAQPAPAA
jgi:hypothetical protein